MSYNVILVLYGIAGVLFVAMMNELVDLEIVRVKGISRGRLRAYAQIVLFVAVVAAVGYMLVYQFWCGSQGGFLARPYLRCIIVEGIQVLP